MSAYRLFIYVLEESRFVTYLNTTEDNLKSDIKRLMKEGVTVYKNKKSIHYPGHVIKRVEIEEI